MITTFTRAGNGDTVGINASKVKSVSEGGSGVLIRFSETHSVTVEGELRAVIDQLNIAQK